MYTTMTAAAALYFHRNSMYDIINDSILFHPEVLLAAEVVARRWKVEFPAKNGS